MCSAGAGLPCCCILTIPEYGRSSPNPNPTLTHSVSLQALEMVDLIIALWESL